MSGLDWVIVGTVVISVLLATAEGFFFEIFALAGVVLGYLLAAWEYPHWESWFLPYVRSRTLAELASFLTIFFVVLLLASVSGRLVRWLFQQAGLRWFDRLLGAAFGLVRGMLIASVLVLGLAVFTPGSGVLASSHLGEYFLVLAHGEIRLAPAELRQRFEQGVRELRPLAAPAPAAGPQGSSAGPPARK